MKRFRLIIPQFPYFNIYSSVAMPPLGAVSVATVLLVIVGLFVLPQRRPVEVSSIQRSAPSAFERQDQRRASDYIPIVEAVDYTGEIRTLQDQPPTIYILEHVSDSTDTKIIY